MAKCRLDAKDWALILQFRCVAIATCLESDFRIAEVAQKDCAIAVFCRNPCAISNQLEGEIAQNAG
ncbi:MAG: hypothetical protein SVX43_13490 [Cyanobacteriota bacterium]|nr:hypothetical protein [Cyanobacteriota bacterium]